MAEETSTQRAININNIRNDVVVTRRGDMRAVLQVNSINFALKSQEEQEGVIASYQNFLNSLDFSIQVVVNSRFMNMEDYLNNIRKLVDEQESQLLQMQTQEYIKFIERFVEEANVISTNFYVIVPFSIIESETEEGIMERLKSLFGKESDVGSIDPERFSHYKGQLMQRVDFVSSGIYRMGLTAKMLTTEELISLFWSSYNPGDLRRKGLVNPLFE